MHLQRLLPHLEQAGISVQMYSVGRATEEHPGVKQVSDKRVRWFFGLLFGPCEPVHYVFSDNTVARAAAALLALLRRVNVVLRVGGETLASAVNSRSALERILIRFAIRRVTVVVGVNQSICDLARRLGARRVLHVPGFIPPRMDQPLPAEVSAFLESRDGPVLLASGEVRMPADEDLYGAYALLQLLERLPRTRLVYYAYRITANEDGQQHLQQEIRRRGLEDRYLLFASSTELASAMLRCDVLVRPTLSDGDSNSIREALYLGMPVVASDCVPRPAGVVTYTCRDAEGLRFAVERVLARHGRDKVSTRDESDYATPIVSLFRELLRGGVG